MNIIVVYATILSFSDALFNVGVGQIEQKLYR